MSLETTINNDIKAAMLAKNEGELRALRAIKSAILLAKTSEGFTGELSSEEEMKILQKQVKSRKDSLEIYEKQNRADLAQKEIEEIAVIERYLPKALSEEELTEAVKGIIAEVGATSISDLGKVMGVASKALAGRADGKAINQVVRSLLS